MSFAEDYCRILDEAEITHSGVIQKDDIELVYFSIDTNIAKNVRINTIFQGHSVSVSCIDICKIPDEKFGDALFICNQLNCKYRFTKMVIDSDSEFNISADAFLDENSGGDETFALVKATFDKIDEAYGMLMKAIWA